MANRTRPAPNDSRRSKRPDRHRPTDTETSPFEKSPVLNTQNRLHNSAPVDSEDEEKPEETQPEESQKGGSSVPWALGGSLGNQESEDNISPTDGIDKIGANPAENALSKGPIKNNLSTPKPGAGRKIRIGNYAVSRSGLAKAGGGGGLVVALITLFIMGSSLYVVHLKNLLTGPSNRINSTISTQLQNRRVRSMFRIIKSGSQKIQVDSFASKARAAGFDVTLKGGKIERLALGEVSFDFAKKTEKEIMKDFNKLTNSKTGTEAGRRFVSTFDNVARESAVRATGPVARRTFLRKYLGILTFIDWIGARVEARAGPEFDDLGSKQQFSDAVLNADSTERAAFEKLDPEDAIRTAGLDPADFPEGSENISDIADRALSESDEYAEKLADAAGVEVPRSPEEANLKNVTDDVLNEADAALRASDEVAEKALKEVAPKLGSKVSANVLNIIGGADITSLPRQGCRVAGTLEFVKSVRNTLLAIELSKFFVRFMTIADHQQAGLVQSESPKLMSIYLQGATGSSGFQSITNGSAVSSVGLSRYGVGYAEVGLMATIAAFIRKVPGLEPNNCKVVNKPLVQAGGILAGGAVAILTGGGSLALSIPVAIGLTVANELAFGIATPILIGSLTKSFVNGFESDPGTMLASASGAFSTMSGGAQGALPTTVDAFDAQVAEADIYREEELSRQSFAERYFDYQNSDSLVARASLSIPQTMPAVGLLTQRSGGLSSITGIFSSIFSFMTPSKALADDVCPDTAAQAYGIACDGFGSPVMSTVPNLDLEDTKEVLLNNGDITGAEQPVENSDFAKVIGNCFSGRPGVLHPIEVDTDGGTETNDPTCVLGGGGKFDTILAGDPGDENDDGTIRTVSALERYAAWYGYLVDTENLSSEINGTQNSSTTTTSNSQASQVISGVDTDDIPCAAGTDAGVVTGYETGVPRKIRVCKVQTINGVNSQIAADVDSMITASINDGVLLSGSSYRTNDAQIAMWKSRCGSSYPITSSWKIPPCSGAQLAQPGYSAHNMGFAIDFNCNGELIGSTAGSCFSWLDDNAVTYGFYEWGNDEKRAESLSRNKGGYEPWHWSISGK